MHCMFSHIPGLYSIDAKSTFFPSCKNQKCPQTLPNVLGGGGGGGETVLN